MTRTIQRLFGSIGFLTTLVGVAASVCFLPSPMVAAPAAKGWVRIKTEPDKAVWYVDAGSIVGKGRYRYFWTYTTGGAPYQDPEDPQKMVYGTVARLSVDCQQKQFRLRYLQLFDQKSNPIKERDYGDGNELKPTTPGTGEAAAVNYVCSRPVQSSPPKR